LVVKRYGRGWSVGGPDEAMVLTRTRREAEVLAGQASAVLRKGGAQSMVRVSEGRRPQEPKSFSET
jgi:hypothetical protein